MYTRVEPPGKGVAAHGENTEVLLASSLITLLPPSPGERSRIRFPRCTIDSFSRTLNHEKKSYKAKAHCGSDLKYWNHHNQRI